MNYDFSITYNDEEYRDVEFFCWLTKSSGPSWSRQVGFEKTDGLVTSYGWCFSGSEHDQFDEFVGTPPAGVVALFNTLTPQMEHLARTGERLAVQCREEPEPA